jgi:hypothetical protein
MTVFEIHYSEYFIENFQKKYLKSIRNLKNILNTVFRILYSEYY